MPSPLGHALFGASLWSALRSEDESGRTAWIGAGLAVLPDVDFVGFALGVPYETMFGHRGITHSILFALVAGTVAWRLMLGPPSRAVPKFLWLYLTLAALSHGILDALTDGGLGVAFFAPFDATRYSFPFRPILVSPLSLEKFLTMRGVRILANEATWVGIPSLVLYGIGVLRRSVRRQHT
ncbi:MAG: metal-dependent hydrolase [Gemmatimonadaceae bacterium]